MIEEIECLFCNTQLTIDPDNAVSELGWSEEFVNQTQDHTDNDLRTYFVCPHCISTTKTNRRK